MTIDIQAIMVVPLRCAPGMRERRKNKQDIVMRYSNIISIIRHRWA
jgi:hypothetical protein